MAYFKRAEFWHRTGYQDRQTACEKPEFELLRGALGEVCEGRMSIEADLVRRASIQTVSGFLVRSKYSCGFPLERCKLLTRWAFEYFDQTGSPTRAHEPRRATQKARSVSSSGGRGRSFFSAVTCCRKATFSNTRSARRRHIARMARTPSETTKTTTLSIAAEFRRLRSGIQAERKSLISWAEQF